MMEVIGAAVVAGAVALVTARGTALWAHKTKKSELEASPYEALAARVVSLETRVGNLEADQRTDRSWITRTILRVLTFDPGLSHLLRPYPAWHGDAEVTPPIDQAGLPE